MNALHHHTVQPPFYDPEKTYEENFDDGPFGSFADGEVLERQGEPRTAFLGRRVFLPFGIPAGPLINGRFVRAAFDKGFDLAVYPTVRTREHPCAPWPNVLAVHVDGDLTPELAERGVAADDDYGHPPAITNAFGVPSTDPDFWQEDMAAALGHARPGQVLIGSFQGTTDADGDVDAYIEDFATAARLVEETGVTILEANLCCPNPGTTSPLCFDQERSRKVVEAIRNEIGDTPLIVKIAYFAEHQQLRELATALDPFIHAVSAINRMPSRISRVGGGALSGVCGAPIKWAGLEMARRLTRLRDENGLDYAVIGVGGVTTPDDYDQYRACGADAVMSATGAMWDPLLAQECWRLESVR